MTDCWDGASQASEVGHLKVALMFLHLSRISFPRYYTPTVAYLAIESSRSDWMEIVRVKRIPERVMGAIGPGHVDPLRCEEVGDGIVTSSPIPVGHSE
jgi:hypothetical protein